MSCLHAQALLLSFSHFVKPAQTCNPAHDKKNSLSFFLLSREIPHHFFLPTYPQAVYEGEAWVGLGFSTTGSMFPADAVIGLPDETTGPFEYDLSSYVSIINRGISGNSSKGGHVYLERRGLSSCFLCCPSELARLFWGMAFPFPRARKYFVFLRGGVPRASEALPLSLTSIGALVGFEAMLAACFYSWYCTLSLATFKSFSPSACPAEGQNLVSVK